MNQALKWGIIILAIVAALYGIWFLGTKKIPEETVLVTVESSDWISGSESAPATLIEYADFQCPACGAYYPLVKRLQEEFGNNFRLVMRHFPLTQIHQNALPAALAAETAGRQGKFWEMYDLLYEHQSDWSASTDVKTVFEGYAGELGLNREQFLTDMADKALEQNITDDRTSGLKAQGQATPTFFLNGKKIDNPQSYEAFKSLIESVIPAGQIQTETTISVSEDTETTEGTPQ